MASVLTHIQKQAQYNPRAPFLVAPEIDAQLTFAELLSHTHQLGAYFAASGVAPGAKVAFLLDNGYWTTVILLGTMGNARVIVPLNAIAGSDQLAYILEHSDAEVLFIAPGYHERLAAHLKEFPRPLQVIVVDEREGPHWPVSKSGTSPRLVEPAASDPAMLLYTSGTTGVPKGAVLTHRAIVTGGQNVTGGHALTDQDRALCVLPVYHINGAIVTVAAPLVSGGSVIMPRRFSAREYWSLVTEYRCTWSSIVPTIVKYLLDRAGEEAYRFGEDSRLSVFRFARSATSALPATMLEQWEATFKVPIIETLGLTETAGTVMTNPPPPSVRKAGSVGKPFGCEAQVIDDSGAPLPDNVSGEIVYRGDNVLDHYYKNPQATDSAFLDGWFRSGDLGFRDAEGYYFLTGRAKELIIRGGENIAPREIDDVLYKHDAVLEAAAVGVADAAYGQEVVACVVLRDGFTCSEAELAAFCAESVGAYKAPKRVYFMDALPKGPSGKIQRLKLPELIDPLDAERGAPAPDS
jgi:acyl-CoA synthetase (AMP-forming)/AMP-acid ligase II